MMIELHGAEAHVAVSGEGPETLLFIHGLMLASESFEAHRAALSRTHKVITFDLRGQGRSAKTTDRLDLDSLAEDAAAIIERPLEGCAGIAGARFRSFARTGHAVMIEQPEAFNEALSDFLRAVA